ncbi:MAG: hypothetical protein ACF8LL_07250, partial [Phycisphaerales bacterium]
MSAHETLAPNMAAITREDIDRMLDHYGCPEGVRRVVERENLLPLGLVNRVHQQYPRQSGLLESRPFLFQGKDQYRGLEGLREVMGILEDAGIHKIGRAH